MFDADDFKYLDPEYFTVIVANEYDVTIMSRSTGHFWYLHSPDCMGGMTIIFHKHRASHPYHLHGRANTMRQAIRKIREHDAFQLNGRRPVKRRRA